MKQLNTHETHQASGGTGGIPQRDPETGEYVVVPYHGANPPLYVQIGGHWVPTGTEPFIGPAKL